MKLSTWLNKCMKGISRWLRGQNRTLPSTLSTLYEALQIEVWTPTDQHWTHMTLRYYQNGMTRKCALIHQSLEAHDWSSLVVIHKDSTRLWTRLLKYLTYLKIRITLILLEEMWKQYEPSIKLQFNDLSEVSSVCSDHLCLMTDESLI